MKIMNDTIRTKLDELLQVDESRYSKLQLLKRPPANASPQALLNMVHKLEIIRDAGILDIDINWLNNNYQRSLTKYVLDLTRFNGHYPLADSTVAQKPLG